MAPEAVEVKDTTFEDNKNEPNTAQTDDYVAVQTVNIYEFMSHAFYGSGGFRDGSYLVSHTRENFYTARRHNCFYKNYTQPIIRAMVDPVFNEDISRSINGDEVNDDTDGFAAEFIQDCDNAGKPLQEFTREAVTLARLHGVVFIVVDNFKTEDQPETVKEAEDARLFPYVYLQTGNQVEAGAWMTDQWGNIESITFIADSEMVKNAQGVIEEKKRWVRWSINLWEKLGKTDAGDWIVLEERTNELGRVPVIALYASVKMDPKNILVDPPLYDIAKLNHAIFNKDSEVRDNERAQGFSMLYVQTDKAGAITAGLHNYMALPMDTNIPPGYASPDSSILTGLVENGEKLREDLFRISGQNGVTGVKEAKSGIAKQWDFIAHELVLKKTSKMATWTEEQTMDLFILYTGETFEYAVKYPMDFQPNAMIMLIDPTLEALDMGLPDKAKNLLKEKVFVALSTILGIDKDKIADAQADFENFKEAPVTLPPPFGGDSGGDE